MKQLQVSFRSFGCSRQMVDFLGDGGRSTFWSTNMIMIHLRKVHFWHCHVGLPEGKTSLRKNMGNL